MTPMEMADPAWRTIAQPLVVKVLVALGGVGLIALELWWFLGRHGEAASAAAESGMQTVRITVQGGYSPARVRLRAGQPVRLVFHRLDPSACVAKVVVPDLQRSLDLPLDAEVSLDLPPLAPGRYPFHCGMAMVRGELEVVNN
ncbi:copper-translocating P-type ATPase [Cyanobium sp. PCC 7001]|uniref:cupredoxin domain-containing protein n=1 Tax=Cyanobium sp. PCC 7001 TaxID=180281 RepID=UPI0001804E1C|nr:cupredoxin domain-containing protein [Cyanobium sp. PCC 7001]EDY37646.1 copper-translocating P-type ATPase [Cyanobium sp. PCC 7001]